MRILIILFRNFDLDFWLLYLEILIGYLNILEFLFIISINVKFCVDKKYLTKNTVSHYC